MANNLYHNKSRHIFGTGIVLAGALVLSIGLIVGLEFPKYIRERRLSRSCITSNMSHDYTDWLYNRNQTKYNLIQIWNITNANAFMNDGESPKFQLLGPYAFIEHEIKLDVSFVNGFLKYKSWKKQTFNRKLTEKLCINCSLGDKITTINPAFLQLINSYMDESKYYLSLVPKLLASHKIRILDKIHSGFNKRQSKQWAWTISEVDFDDWLHRGDANFKRVLQNDKKLQMTPATYLRIYDTLGNPRIYGSDILKRRDWWNRCESHFQSIIDKQLTNISNNNVNDFNQVPSCGLVFYFYKLQITSVMNWRFFRPQLSSLLCDIEQKNNTPCFFQSSNTRFIGAYLQALVSYTINYLPKLLQAKSPPLSAVKLLATLSVKDLVSGYCVDGMNFAFVDAIDGHSWTSWPQISRVSGLLEHYETEALARVYAHRIKLRTCLFNKSRNDNLNFEEMNEMKCLIEPHIQPNSCPSGKVQVAGLQHFKILPAQNLSPCLGPSPPESSYIFYVAEMWRPASYIYTGSTQYDWVKLCKFNMQFMGKKSLYGQSTSAITGYLSWVKPVATNKGFPDFVIQELRIQDFKEIHSLNNTIEDFPRNQILIEPVTGEIWSSESYMRFYVGIKDDFFIETISFNDSSSSLGVPIKFYEVYSRTEPNGHLFLKYHTEVHVLLQASCVGLIGLSIVGSVIILVGIGVAFAIIQRPAYRVGPDLNIPCDGVVTNKSDEECQEIYNS